MATFLTTPRMSPALAERVEAAVAGRPVARRPPIQVAGARVAALMIVAGLVTLVALRWQARDAELTASRASLLTAIESGRNALSERERQVVSRASALLAEAVDAPAVPLTETSLHALLSTPAIYVRGSAGAFRSQEGTQNAIRDSVKDTFVLCLLDPPARRTEKAMLAKVQLAYSGGLAERTEHVRRLHTAAIGLPYLTRAFMKRVEEASSHNALAKLRDEFDRAPHARASVAAKAELLIYVLDEAAAEDAPAELDGTARHEVKVGVVHIPSGKPRLRFEGTVDPSWISSANRPEMSRGLTSCRLALDVRRFAEP